MYKTWFSRFLSRLRTLPGIPWIFLSSEVTPVAPFPFSRRYDCSSMIRVDMIPSVIGLLILGTLRSIGQVAFVNSAVTGLLIYVGCSLSNPLSALLGIIATATCTSLGYLIKPERERAINGLHGYNGFLVGMGMGYFDTGLSLDKSAWYRFGVLLVPLLCATLLCFFVHMALSRSRLVPPFTFAYNISLSCWLAFAVGLGPTSAFYPVFVSSQIVPPSNASIEYSAIDFGWFIRSVLAGVGQVYFSPALVPSIIITVGLVVGSPIAGLLGLLGSVVGNGVAIIAHSQMWAAEIGLDGLSAVLCAIGLGGFVFVCTRWAVLVAICGSIFCVAARHVFSGLLVHPTGPAMTFPFCVIATLIVLAAEGINCLIRVPAEVLGSCESHLASRQDAELVAFSVAGGNSVSEAEIKAACLWPDLRAKIHKLDSLE